MRAVALMRCATAPFLSSCPTQNPLPLFLRSDRIAYRGVGCQIQLQYFRTLCARKAYGLLSTIKTLGSIIRDNFRWRHQIWNLALSDLVRDYRGTAFGAAWLFVKPAVYIAVYWLTISIGMRGGGDVEGAPFLLWLASGVFAWFFMSDMINTGSDIFRRYSHLVSKLKFPISVIPTFYALSKMIVCVGTFVFMVIICMMVGIHPSRYWLQLPLVLILMLVFWVAWSIMLSPLSAISKDFAKLIQTLSMPFFWLSGVIFDIRNFDAFPLLAQIAKFNPVSWACEAVRSCFVYKEWFFLNFDEFVPFLIVLLVVVYAASAVFKRLYKEVPDVI